VDLDKPVLLLTLALFLSLGIERALELFRALFDHLEARRGKAAAKEWRKKAEKLRDLIEAHLENARAAGSKSALQTALFIACRHLGPPSAASGGLMAISAEQVRKTSIRLRYKLLAVTTGVLFAILFKLNIFLLVDEYLGKAPASEVPAWLGTLGVVVTGIAMGFGAGPVHAMITALERARQTRI
jgi:hypothetical protein